MENNSVNNSNIEMREKKEDSIDLRYIVDVVWDLKYWIALSLVIALLAGYLFLKVKTPEYTRSATVLIANDRMTGGAGLEMQLLSDITGMRANGLIQNEIYILKSRPLMQAVVEDLSLNVRYYGPSTFFKDQELYRVSPVEMELISASRKNKYPYVAVEFEVGEDTLAYTVRKLSFISNAENAKHPVLKEFKGRTYNFGDAVQLPDDNTLVLTRTEYARLFKPGKYKAVFVSPKKMAKYYSSRLSAGTTDYKERSSVISLTMQDNIISRADDILNTLIAKYNEDTRNFLSLSTSNTLAFIDERLSSLETQLGDIETEVRNYKTDNTLVDFMLQSESIIKKGTEYESQITQLGIQLQFLDMIREYLADDSNEFSLLPANIGIEDQGLTTVINDYNTVVIERRRLMLGASETNPRVIALTNQIQDMRKAILLSINQLRDSYQYRYDVVLKEAMTDKDKMAEIPNQQLDMAKIERQQMIVEPLYVLLRQKKEEALISLYAQTDNARIVEPADGPDTPSSPQPLMIYAFCFLLGFVVPPGVFFLKHMLQRRVYSIKDVKDRTSLPVIGYIPVSESVMVVQGSRDILTETYRAVRANMGFLSAKVIQITSSISGEGKSTVAVNLALTLAFAGKKVLFIETDLRNGFDYRVFNVQKSSHGLATYLSGTDSLEEVLRRGVINQNLDVILRGTMPPNPNELLSGSKMENLIAEMREKYDYVICDSAPYVIISDPIVVNNYTDATFYVVRCGVSDLRFLDELNFASETRRLKNISIIINGINPKTKIYGSYGGYGYGYGYGYGGNERKFD